MHDLAIGIYKLEGRDFHVRFGPKKKAPGNTARGFRPNQNEA
jgi:hypothetical protein